MRKRVFKLLALLSLILAVSTKVEAQDASNALSIGDKAINFTLKNTKGEKVKLYDKLKSGPVILTWYRGGWCPYCNLALVELQDHLEEFEKYDAQLIAISPQVPDKSLSTQEKNELRFEVLSDVDAKVGNKYKIMFSLDESTKERYEKGFGLSNFNGNEKGELPIPATYVIGTDKIIKYAFVDVDYKKRADVEELIETLEKL